MTLKYCLTSRLLPPYGCIIGLPPYSPARARQLEQRRRRRPRPHSGRHGRHGGSLAQGGGGTGGHGHAVGGGTGLSARVGSGSLFGRVHKVPE